MLQLQVISPTSSLKKLKQFENPNIDITFGNFLMKTTKIICVLSKMIRLNVEKGIFSFSFEDTTVKKCDLQQVLNFINGDPLIINEQNFEELLTIGSLLEIPIILEKAFLFSEIIDIRNLLFDPNSGIPEKIKADIIASVFELFYDFLPLKQQLPFFIQSILLSEKLVIQSEEYLCSWLIDYRKNIQKEYDTDSLMLFSYVYSENFSEEYCKKIINIKDANVKAILMEKRLTFGSDSSDQCYQTRYKKRSNEQLFYDLINHFSFLPIIDKD